MHPIKEMGLYSLKCCGFGILGIRAIKEALQPRGIAPLTWNS